MLAGGRVRVDANVGADCVGRQRIAEVCVPAHPNHNPSPDTSLDHRLWRLCSLAQLSCLARRVLVSGVLSGQQARAEQLRQRGRQRAVETCADRVRVHGCVRRVRCAVCLAGTLWCFVRCWRWSFVPTSSTASRPLSRSHASGRVVLGATVAPPQRPLWKASFFAKWAAEMAGGCGYPGSFP